MKTIIAPTIISLEKAVNDYIHTNSAYRPTHIAIGTKRVTAKPKAPKEGTEPAKKTATKDQQQFTCLLQIAEDTRPKTASFFHGSLEALASSQLPSIPPRSITYSHITTLPDGNCIAIIVQ